MQRQRLIKDVDACHLCGQEFPRDQLALDHVVPVAGDLTRALDEKNLAPACEPCHTAKSGGEQAQTQRDG
ncbi:HNH endonuclease, partial [Streptomyces sp. NPDC002920]